MKKEKKKENIAPAPGNPEAPCEAKTEKDPGQSPGNARSKKKAIIFIAAVLILAAVLIPLSFVDWAALFKDRAQREFSRNIVYYTPDYKSDIFQSEEYLSHLGADMAVSVKADGVAEYTYDFHDLPSAEEAFAKVAQFENGAQAVGDYFFALLCGCRTAERQEAFRALFTEDYKGEIPLSFPPQKIYNLHMEYRGKEPVGEKYLDKWLVSFDVVRNDGTVLNYTGARDGGQAWFLVEEEQDRSLIALISGVVYIN